MRRLLLALVMPLVGCAFESESAEDPSGTGGGAGFGIGGGSGWPTGGASGASGGGGAAGAANVGGAAGAANVGGAAGAANVGGAAGSVSSGGSAGAASGGAGGSGGALPVCDCFVQSAWCGSGVGKEAQKMGCTVPLLPAHNGDILYCPGGKWTVKQSCSQGCVEAPAGTPDYCKSTTGTGDQNPVPGYKITTPFGKPGSWAAGYHTGDDYAAPSGTKVVATRGGVVKAKSTSYWGSAYGLHVVIETNGVRHGYAHLSSAAVSVGQTVSKGQHIGNVGSTGNSTGPHLHYEERTSPFGYYDHRNPQFNK